MNDYQCVDFNVQMMSKKARLLDLVKVGRYSC